MPTFHANYRTTIAGLIAGLTFVASALVEDGPWTTARVLRVIVGACISALGVVARDASTQPAALPAVDVTHVAPPLTPRATPPDGSGVSDLDFGVGP